MKSFYFLSSKDKELNSLSELKQKMAQDILQIRDLCFDQALVVTEEGKTAFEVFSEALKGKKISKASLPRFQPFINKKQANWDDVVKVGDQLQVLPKIAGGN